MDRLFPRSLETAAHVLTDAEFTRQEIIEYFRISPSRITSIPLAARAIFRPRTEDACRAVLAEQRLGYRSYILCAGTLEPRKNLDFMPPHHIRKLCLEIGFSRVEVLPDPTLAILAVYGLNLATMEHTDRLWRRRVIRIARLLLDNTLRHGAICVITK